LRIKEQETRLILHKRDDDDGNDNEKVETGLLSQLGTDGNISFSMTEKLQF
jgi:hypothetical protein